MTLGVEGRRVEDRACDASCCKKLFRQAHTVTVTEIYVEYGYREAAVDTPHCSA